MDLCGCCQTPNTRVILCPALSTALQTATTLTPDQFANLTLTDEAYRPITHLRCSDVIASSSGFFRPTPPYKRCWALGPLTSLAQAWHDY